MKYRVLPYKQGSKSAKALAEELGGKVLKLKGSTYIQGDDDTVINWGNADISLDIYSSVSMLHILNKPSLIKQASNKLQFFQLMKETHPDVIPEFFTSKDEIPEGSYPVVCRTVLSGHSGDGIVIAGSPDELVEAGLFVKYQKKKDEYRVHLGRISNGDSYVTRVIAVQRKAKRNGFEGADFQIRNHQNGFVYVRSGVNPPDQVMEYAIDAFEATGLDFGAVDVIWNSKKEQAYVLEINTAPGLEGTTVKDYADFFRGLS